MRAKPKKGTPRQLAPCSGQNDVEKAEDDDECILQNSLALDFGEWTPIPPPRKHGAGAVGGLRPRSYASVQLIALTILTSELTSWGMCRMWFWYVLLWLALPSLERVQYQTPATRSLHASFGRSSTPMGLPHVIGGTTKHPERQRAMGAQYCA